MTPWTKRELQREMRIAGWERLAGPGSAYQHKVTGRIVNLLAWTTEAGEVYVGSDSYPRIAQVAIYEWQRWAAARETPPPF